MHKLMVFSAATLGLLSSESGVFANPVYTLTLQDAAGTVTQTDNGTGSISYSGTLGGFTIQDLSVTNLNATNPFDVAFGSQDIFRATGSDSLNVFVTVSNLPAIVPTLLTIGTTSEANFQGSHIMGWSSQTYFDPGDRTGMAGLIDLISTSSGGIEKNGFLASAVGSAMLSGSPFSYTVEFTLDLRSNEFANGAGASTDIVLPEPWSAGLLLPGLVGIGFIRRTGRAQTGSRRGGTAGA